MQASNILQADLLDIIFEGRNKAYGAYELRKSYNRRLYYALSSTAFICLLFVAGSLLANAHKERPAVITITPDINISTVDDKVKKPMEKTIPKPKPIPVETVKNVTVVIVPDDKFKPQDQVPLDKDLDSAAIGNFTQKGAKDDKIPEPVAAVKGTGAEPAITTPDDGGGIFPRVEIEAKFPGGLEEWRRFLERNLRSDVPIENGASSGKYTVIVSFVVDKEGTISDVQAENDPGYGTAAEAVRVIKKSNKWIPAIQNGRNVMYRQKQSIAFLVNDN